MARPKSGRVTKKTAGYSLHPEVIDAIDRKARELAVKHDRKISASLVVEKLLRKGLGLK